MAAIELVYSARLVWENPLTQQGTRACKGNFEVSYCAQF